MKFLDDPTIRLIQMVGMKEAAIKLKITEPELHEAVLILRGREDAEFFDNTFLKIQTKAGELVSLTDNPVQKRIQQAIDNARLLGKPVRLKIPKARRHGVSTKVQALFYRDMYYQSHIHGLTVCNDLESATNMRDMFARYHDNFPLKAKSKLKKVTPKTWKFSGKDIDYLIDTADELDTGRSFTIHRLHGSEVAFWRDPETLMTGLLRSVDFNPNTLIVLESTANGMGGWWYEFIVKDNGYELLFFPWMDDSGNTLKFVDDKEKLEFERSLDTEERSLRDKYTLSLEQLHWRREEIKNGFNGDADKFRQEYPANLEESFLTSGRPFFPVMKIRERLLESEKIVPRTGYLEEKDDKITFTEDRDGWWKIFEEPKEGYEYRYVTGSDSAEGKIVSDTTREPDNSVCAVFDRLTKRDSARFCAVLDTDLFAEEIYKVSKYYKSACECVERNSSGLAVIDGLKNREGINLYRREVMGKVEEGETIEYGFQTNMASRDSLLSELRTRIREGSYLSSDYELWKECSHFVYDEKGKPQAQKGTHDDRVLSAALAVQAEHQANELYEIVRPEAPAIVTYDMDGRKKINETEVDYATF